jgi:hypothetical protein
MTPATATAMPAKEPTDARSAPDLLPAVAEGLAAEDLLELPDPLALALALPLPPSLEPVGDDLADAPVDEPVKEVVRVQSHDEL